MSIKDQVKPVTSNQFVLEKFGTMKTDAFAFLSEELFRSSEDEVWEQIYNSSSYEGVIGAYLMPDCHVGYGTPIGSVVVTENTLIQACNGYDISCGIISMKVPGLDANRVKSYYQRERLITEIEKRVSTGVGSSRPKLMPDFTKSQCDDILMYGALSLGVDAEYCERQYLPIADSVDLTKIENAYNKVLSQLGSVGSGNHYIEIQCDPADGQVWVMIHCGSRGYGWQTANWFFHEAAKLRGLPANRRESSHLRIDEHLGKMYWDYCSSAANFAIANRHIITRGVNEALQEVFGVEGTVYYEISHNLVQEETLVLPNGATKKGFVHRKGATRAFPGGHPDLVGTKWAETGHPCLIPGSMFEGAAILFPKAGAYQSACSVNHGSGRILGRKEAERKLHHKQEAINGEMRNVRRTFNGVEIEGIVSNLRKIPLDECGHVYKNLDDVLKVLTNENIATIEHRLYPIANIKSDEDGDRKKKKSSHRD